MKEMVTQLRPIVGTKAACRHLELSRAMADVLDPGLALFAGLGAMPKQSTLTDHCRRVHLDNIRRLMEDWHRAARSLGVAPGQGESFDLDFHPVPYHGDDALA